MMAINVLELQNAQKFGCNMSNNVRSEIKGKNRVIYYPYIL